MTIQEILILTAAALTTGIAYRQFQKTNLLMVASIIFIYWLQPDTGLRYLGYWLPSISLVIMVISWVVTASPEVRKQSESLKTLVLIILIPLIISSLRLLDPDQILDFVIIPQLWGIVIFWSVAGLFLAVLLRLQKPLPTSSLWVIFSVIILLFIIIKTPALAQLASKTWRSFAGQSLDLASATELSWLGFSYFAFRILHTIRDKQAGRLPEIALNEYITYLTFFPAFLAGPIARADHFIASLRDIVSTLPDDLVEGTKRIVLGLFKKFVLADSLALIALNSQNALHPNSTWGAWILLYAFSFQIYFDFSGYTDVAIGLARFFNIKLPDNFNRPYLKPNLTQFWSNWHMTLTNWFRAYFFNPLSRSLRKKKFSALSILFITQLSTMILVGLWHGVTVNFVFWGLWHGLGLLIQNRWSVWINKRIPPTDKKWTQFIRDGVGIFLTFNYVSLGWIWFILPTPELARDFLLILLGGSA
jgi:D-alanyl-lipoteichoic acid acyltransferase DltB (MBOAT superfamily)